MVIIRDGVMSRITRVLSEAGRAASPYSAVSDVHAPRKFNAGREVLGSWRPVRMPCTDVGSDSSSFWTMRAFWYVWRRIAESRWRTRVERVSP